MPSDRVQAIATGVTLTLATPVAVVTVTPSAAVGNQVTAGTPVLVSGRLVITGAASATNCAVSIVRGAGTGGASIATATFSVDAAVTARTAVVEAQETAANFNAVNGVYTLVANAGGAAQTGTIGTLEVQPLQGGV